MMFYWISQLLLSSLQSKIFSLLSCFSRGMDLFGYHISNMVACSAEKAMKFN